MRFESSALWLFLTWLACLTLKPCTADEFPTCRPEDYHYEFTECDEQGGRWRVSVPKPNTCIGGSPNSAVRANCSTSCEPGMYLYKYNSECQPCLAGTYSLGGGIYIDNWSPLPKGFEISQESFASSFRFLQQNAEDGPSNCTKYQWTPYEDYIFSDGGPCSSELRYSVKLVKPGNLTFEYQNIDDYVLLTFEVQNDRCQSLRQSENYRFPSKTDEDEWKQMIVPLSKGQNVLYWKTIGMGGREYYNHKLRPVKIRSVNITGVAYTSECTPCPNGTYSTDKSSYCTPCPENHYSERNSSSCKKCNTVSEYSPVGSSSCLKRQNCTKLDYHAVYEQCDEQKNTTTISYKWREPKICYLDNTIQLPPNEVGSCMRCNTGMEQSGDSTCKFCPPNQYSDGVSKCQPCPPSTAPNYEVNYKVWNSIPPNMLSTCLAQGPRCGSDVGWIPMGNYIRTAQNHNGENVYLVLKMEVDGFRSKEKVINGRPANISLLTFTFDMSCTSNCVLYFMEDMKIVSTFKGSNNKDTYEYPIGRNDSYVFAWAFAEEDVDDNIIQTENRANKVNENFVRIYSVTVTNTMSGGASSCVKCNKGKTLEGCIPCPLGHYFEGGNCHKCPQNTHVTDRFARGRGSCKPCGAGLHSEDGHTCYSECAVPVSVNGQIDFSRLPKSIAVQGIKLFSSNGLNYHHLFNISLCGKPNPQATCSNNLTNQVSEVKSSICRLTIVPPQNEDDRTIATQAVSIGDWLIGVTKKPSYQNIHVLPQFLTGPDSSPDDIHFYYVASSRTQACPYGRNTTITLHCDPSTKDPGEIFTPKNCSDGTCDGCSFHFLWKTQRACRVCTSEDYEIVKGECKKGVQTLHYISSRACVPGNDWQMNKVQTQACTVVPFELQTVIACSVALGVLLLAMLMYCWKKNRKLEYKYMKLVQSGSSKEGELPTAESCAIYDDDDDQYDAVVTTGTGRSSLLSKFQGSGRGNNDDNSERIHLTKNRSQL